MQGGVPRFARELTKPLAKSLLIVNVDVLSTEEDDASLGNYTPDQDSATRNRLRKGYPLSTARSLINSSALGALTI